MLVKKIYFVILFPTFSCLPLQLPFSFPARKTSAILIPRAHDPFNQHQNSTPLPGPDFLNMRKIFTSCSQPIRFPRFDNKLRMQPKEKALRTKLT